jgi:hypothetical protein
MNKVFSAFIILLFMISHGFASILLANIVSAPSFMIAKLIHDGTEAFDVEWAMASNITQMSTNLSAIAFASFNVPSTALWLPFNTTIAVSVMVLGSFLSPNGTFLQLTRTDIHPFESVASVRVNISTHYSIISLERAFGTPNCTGVYALLSTKFMSSATLVAEISNGWRIKNDPLSISSTASTVFIC